MSNVAEFKARARITGSPGDLQAEEAVLGALLYDSGVLDRISDQVSAEMFFWPLHGRIYDLVTASVHRGGRADPITVAHGLRNDPELAEVGGPSFLLDLVEKCETTSSLADWAKIVHELWQRRELISIGEQITAAAKAGELSASLIENAEKSLLSLQINSRSIALVSAEEAVARVINQLENPEQAFGIKLGLEPIDEETGGFMPGELWLCAGRPSMGKSACASSAALHVARHGRSASGKPLGVIEICSEMTVEQMMRRHIADLAYELHGRHAPTYSDMRKRTLTANQGQIFREASSAIRQLPTLRSLYRTGLTVLGLRGLIRRQITTWARQDIDVGLVTVDHVGLIRASAQTRGRTEAQGEVARELKEVCGELNIPMLALVQLNRKVEDRDDKHPLLSDLRDSGEWEENADGVIGCYRDSYYAKRQPEPKRHDEKLLWDERCNSQAVEALLLKVREGEAKTVKLWADMGHNAIRGHAPANLYDPGPLMARALDPDVQFSSESTPFD